MMGLALLEHVVLVARRPLAPYYTQCSMKPACVKDIALWGEVACDHMHRLSNDMNRSHA